jgi:hypothetical protein
MLKIKTIKNCLSKEQFKNLKEILYSEYFAWYFNFGVNDKNDGHTQFTHTFYDNYKVNSTLFDNLKSIIDVLNPLSLIRIKANLLLKTDKIIKHGLHIDQQYKSTTAILYINTNNGYTEFENGEKIFSEENKLVIFDNFLKHGGTTCTDKHERMVINFNYINRLQNT